MTDVGKPNVVRPLPSWVPAGWYPDPLGQGEARYWDGKRWTLEYRDSPSPNPVKAAKEYLSTSSFLCQGLIEQLSSEAGDKYTVAQAEYGAKQAGIC